VRHDNEAGKGDIEMLTIVAIILADLIVVSLFIYRYRQELGLTVNGSHDKPVVRKRFVGHKPVREDVADDKVQHAQVVTRAGTTANRTSRTARRQAQIGAPRQTT